MAEFAGKTVLITGALGTLGTAQTRAFASEGAHLILLDRSSDATGESRAQAISREFGGPTRYLDLDLGDLQSSEATIRKLSDELGGIDVLVSNAALIINKPFEDFSIEEYELQMRVNSAATFALIRAVAPGMKAKKDGRIVNFCSLTLNGRWEGYVPYIASKGAMLGLTKSLARELGPFNIRVNAISPGAVVSDAERGVFADRLQQYNDWIIENQSLKSRIQPEDVADMVMFLASDRSPHNHWAELSRGWRLVIGPFALWRSIPVVGCTPRRTGEDAGATSPNCPNNSAERMRHLHQKR